MFTINLDRQNCTVYYSLSSIKKIPLDSQLLQNMTQLKTRYHVVSFREVQECKMEWSDAHCPIYEVLYNKDLMGVGHFRTKACLAINTQTVFLQERYETRVQHVGIQPHKRFAHGNGTIISCVLCVPFLIYRCHQTYI